MKNKTKLTKKIIKSASLVAPLSIIGSIACSTATTVSDNAKVSLANLVALNMKSQNRQVVNRTYSVFVGNREESFQSQAQALSFIEENFVKKDTYSRLQNFSKDPLTSEVSGQGVILANSNPLLLAFRKADGSYTYARKDDTAASEAAREEAAISYITIHNAYNFDGHYFENLNDVESYIKGLSDTEKDQLISQMDTGMRALRFANGSVKMFRNFEEIRKSVAINAIPYYKDANNNLVRIEPKNIPTIRTHVSSEDLSYIPISSTNGKTLQVVDMDSSTPNGNFYGPYLVESGLGLEGIKDPYNWKVVSEHTSMPGAEKSLEENLLTSFTDYIMLSNGSSVESLIKNIIIEANGPTLSAYLALISKSGVNYAALLDEFLLSLSRGTRFSALNALILSRSFIMDQLVKNRESVEKIQRVSSYYFGIVSLLDSFASSSLSTFFIKDEVKDNFRLNYYRKALNFGDGIDGKADFSFQNDPSYYYRRLMGDNETQLNTEDQNNKAIFAIIKSYLGTVGMVLDKVNDIQKEIEAQISEFKDWDKLSQSEFSLLKVVDIAKTLDSIELSQKDSKIFEGDTASVGSREGLAIWDHLSSSKLVPVKFTHKVNGEITTSTIMPSAIRNNFKNFLLNDQNQLYNNIVKKINADFQEFAKKAKELIDVSKIYDYFKGEEGRNFIKFDTAKYIGKNFNLFITNMPLDAFKRDEVIEKSIGNLYPDSFTQFNSFLGSFVYPMSSVLTGVILVKIGTEHLYQKFLFSKPVNEKPATTSDPDQTDDVSNLDLYESNIHHNPLKPGDDISLSSLDSQESLTTYFLDRIIGNIKPPTDDPNLPNPVETPAFKPGTNETLLKPVESLRIQDMIGDTGEEMTHVQWLKSNDTFDSENYFIKNERLAFIEAYIKTVEQELKSTNKKEYEVWNDIYKKVSSDRENILVHDQANDTYSLELNFRPSNVDSDTQETSILLISNIAKDYQINGWKVSDISELINKLPIPNTSSKEMSQLLSRFYVTKFNDIEVWNSKSQIEKLDSFLADFIKAKYGIDLRKNSFETIQKFGIDKYVEILQRGYEVGPDNLLILSKNYLANIEANETFYSLMLKHQTGDDVATTNWQSLFENMTGSKNIVDKISDEKVLNISIVFAREGFNIDIPISAELSNTAQNIQTKKWKMSQILDYIENNAAKPNYEALAKLYYNFAVTRRAEWDMVFNENKFGIREKTSILSEFMYRYMLAKYGVDLFNQTYDSNSHKAISLLGAFSIEKNQKAIIAEFDHSSAINNYLEHLKSSGTIKVDNSDMFLLRKNDGFDTSKVRLGARKHVIDNISQEASYKKDSAFKTINDPANIETWVTQGLQIKKDGQVDDKKAKALDVLGDGIIPKNETSLQVKTTDVDSTPFVNETKSFNVGKALFDMAESQLRSVDNMKKWGALTLEQWKSRHNSAIDKTLTSHPIDGSRLSLDVDKIATMTDSSFVFVKPPISASAEQNLPPLTEISKDNNLSSGSSSSTNVVESQVSLFTSQEIKVQKAIQAPTQTNVQVPSTVSSEVISALSTKGVQAALGALNMASAILNAFGVFPILGGIGMAIGGIVQLINGFASQKLLPYEFLTKDGKSFLWDGSKLESSFWGLKNEILFTIRDLKVNVTDVLSPYTANHQGIYYDGKFYKDTFAVRQDYASEVVEKVLKLDRTDEGNWSTPIKNVVWKVEIDGMDSSKSFNTIQEAISFVENDKTFVSGNFEKIYSVFDHSITSSISVTHQALVDAVLSKKVNKVLIFELPNHDTNGNPLVEPYSLPLPSFKENIFGKLPDREKDPVAYQNYIDKSARTIVFNTNVSQSWLAAQEELDPSKRDPNFEYFKAISKMKLNEIYGKFVKDNARSITIPTKNVLFENVLREGNFDKLKSYSIDDVLELYSAVDDMGQIRYFESSDDALKLLINQNIIRYTQNDNISEEKVYSFNNIQFESIEKIYQYLSNNDVV